MSYDPDSSVQLVCGVVGQLWLGLLAVFLYTHIIVRSDARRGHNIFLLGWMFGLTFRVFFCQGLENRNRSFGPALHVVLVVGCFPTLALFWYLASVVTNTRVPALTSNHQLPRPAGAHSLQVKNVGRKIKHISYCTVRKGTLYPRSPTLPKGSLPVSRRPDKQRQ